MFLADLYSTRDDAEVFGGQVLDVFPAIAIYCRAIGCGVELVAGGRCQCDVAFYYWSVPFNYRAYWFGVGARQPVS